MKKQLIASGISKPVYETSRIKNEDTETKHSYKKLFNLLAKQQEEVGDDFKVSINRRVAGDILIPSFRYQRKSEIEKRIDKALLKARGNR
jgi:hypothetical protein